ncbi:TerB N-terminal domain-containing protein [Chelativorans sp. M5D2P16]|uniref:TerB N-terminal domain-containing protein n=1 Tax=Chelativorans sp. M5D2P16 TaxID=3095678 RepID=UPI002ACA2C3D|nr:TerB N-terminal domain-containing protein [Chelativorans sp. M5D2P16]MDZ5698691.1 TerB N-terminal domain-containing protein [Chelativorans sp. M5D2P16]
MRSQGWIPAGETVSVAGRELGGMIYVGTPPLLNTYGYRDKCRAYIDPSLTVARLGSDRDGHGMPYWPGYSDISPQCRATYLDWLAGGRADGSYNPGYMFLYFYGLERHFFVDDPPAEEKRQLVDEVQRLAQTFADNRSVQRYLGEFIEVAKVATTEIDKIEPIFESSSWELPLSLQLAIGTRLDKGEQLNADWTLSWLLCHPERNLRTPATRCRDEFIALFKMRFDERFPDGLKVNKPRKTLKASYRAASSEFEGTINPSMDGKPIPDISGLRRPVEIAQEIADGVMDDLDKFSRFLGRNPDGRGSLEAHALLPSELWALFPSEGLENLKSWAAEIVAAGGLVPLASAIERLEGERPQKIGKRQLAGAADALARIGFGLAPDPRFALRSPKHDEPVVVFELGERVEKLEDVSPQYRTALMELALGSFVAHADGHIADTERRSLEEQVVATEGLNEQEKRRLRANLSWFLAVPPDMSLLRRKLKDVGEANQAAMRAALVAAAHSDGMIQSEEVASIEKVYKALGLDPALAYSDLHAGDIPDAPRTVRAAQPGAPGEAIPDDRQPTGPTLDASRIASIRSDTERVSSVLGQIFDAGEYDVDAATGNEAVLLAGLDRKHAALVQDLVEREHWTEDAFEQLCSKYSLLASGALEAVNEWAFETYDEALLDEYHGYDVIPEIAQAVKQELTKEGGYVQTETA